MKHNQINLLVVFTALFFSNSIHLFGQNPPQFIADSLQSILDRSLPTNFSNPGAVLGVHVPGQWSWNGASGYAIAGITNGQSQTTATAETQFRVGSITKNMVATCILKLEQEGHLSIDDPIDLFLRTSMINDTLMPSETVKIRHLLNHTSGIPNSADNTSCQQDVLSNPLGAHTLEDAVYCGAVQGEIFPAGFAWAYSNTNYSLLAMIIEEVSGMPYQAYLTQNIIIPHGLNNTVIPITNQIEEPHMGCYWNIGNWIDLTIINPSTYTGWADVVSTTEDLNKYYTALLDGLIINEFELNQMKTVDPTAFDYGMGMDMYILGGKNYVGHTGEVANTSGMFYSDLNSAIAPNGYYISYNFNTQGVNLKNAIDQPVFDLLNATLSTSIDDAPIELLTVYPNPATEQITVMFNFPVKEVNLSLLDLQGRKLNSCNFSLESMTVEMNISVFPKGVYLLRILADGKERIQKLKIE